MRNLFFAALIISFPSYLLGQGLNPPLYRYEHLSMLKDLEESSLQLAGKNLNRFAIDRLIRYDQSLDSLYFLEKKDSLNKIEQLYLRSTDTKQRERKILKEQIRILGLEKDVLSTEFHSLLRKAAFAFIIWVVLIFIIIQIRRKKVNVSEHAFEASEVQLNAIEKRLQLSESAISGANKLSDKATDLVHSLQQLKQISMDHSADPEWPAEVGKGLEKACLSAEKELMIIQLISGITSVYGEEKVSTDINQLCDACVEIAHRGFAANYPDLNCQIGRDFEKKLPEIKVVPMAVASMILNVLLNAFQSVQEKHASNLKGYQPKINISTRILPRFLQIRIRDNGLGMSDEIISKSVEEFFSTKSPELAAGLGLSESMKVMTKLHKGEIKIESEKANNCDVYIKFFI